ncbi:MAG: DUF6383 domain-containing protein [Parabacteroides gordonii]|uniref:DUF6383 domain-containing protein n=1 Tax=Parabacteroides gordonii TaxID=574930 RepID=UPI003A86B1C9
MNKKFSTLVAVLLAAGAWMTLDAKVVEVATPIAGQSYLIGAGINASESVEYTLLLGANGQSAPANTGGVTVSTPVWTLVEVTPNKYKLQQGTSDLYAVNGGSPASGGVDLTVSASPISNSVIAQFTIEDDGKLKLDNVSDYSNNNDISGKTLYLKLNSGAAASLAEVSGSPSIINFGVYGEDAYLGLPGLSDLAFDASGVVNTQTLPAKAVTAPFYITDKDGNYLSVKAEGDGYKVEALGAVVPTAAQSLNASWTWNNGVLTSVAAARAGKIATLNATSSATPVYTLGTATPVTAGDDGLYISTNKVISSVKVSLTVAAPAASVKVNDANNSGILVKGVSKLLASVPSDYCLVGVTQENGTVEYLKAGATTVAGATTEVQTALDATNYQSFLWKVGSSVDGTDYNYTFTSLAKDGDKAIQWQIDGTGTFTSGVAYSSGMVLSHKGDNIKEDAGAGNDKTKAIIGFYEAPVLAKTQAELNGIYNPGFEMTVKVSKDGKEAIEDIDVFGKKMYPIGTSATATSVELWDNAKGDAAKGAKILVLDKTEKVGNETSPVGGQFKWITKTELDKNSANYESDFSFRYSATSGNPETDMVNQVVVGGSHVLYILPVQGKYYLTTVAIASVDAETALPYVKLGASNVYDVKKLLGQYLSFAYADTKANTQESELYKLNALLTVVYDADANGKKGGVVADFALGSSTSLPEAQWAVTDADLSQNTVTLTNRENPDVTIENVMFRAEGNKFVMTVAGTSNISDDLVTMTALSVDKATNFDGYMQTTPNVLRNENFYLGQYHAIEGNNNAYFVENHTEAGSHQIGMTAEKENAQKWNLHFAMKDDEEGNTTLVDTVKVPLTFATLIDGKIATDAKNKDVVKDTLFILPYAFQNASNREFVSYKTGKGFEFYFCNKDEKEDQNDDAVVKFALKMKPDNTYNFVEISGNEGSRALSANKVLAGNSANKGILSRTGTYVYDQNENSLMVVEKADAPEYHKIAMAWGDTIKLFREENESQVVYEKLDAKSVVEKDTLSFLNIDNINQFKVNPAIFADTAYINRVDANGELNTCYQYLLAVNVNPDKSYYCPYNPEHNTDEWRKEHNGPCADAKEHRAVYGRYLINLIDTANVYGATHLHNNPYINNVEADENLAKLSFVEGYHIGDTLIVTRKGGEAVKLRMDTPDFNVAKFAFRYVDSAEKTFKIQTQYKPYLPGTDADEIDAQATNNGYLKWVNGTLAVTDRFDNGDVFGIEENYEGNPVANEDITTSSISVIAQEGKVIINGAAGKKVTISNVLGQTIANTVLSSDNATISAPAGVVVVAVEGEAAVKAIVK